jgi:WD40 repeat protein
LHRKPAVVFAPDGRTLAWPVIKGNNGEPSIKIIDSAEGKVVTTLPMGQESPVLAFSPTNRLLAVGHEDGTITVWDWRRELMVAEFQGHVGAVTAVVFTPDERTLISASRDATVRLWTLPPAVIRR